MNEKIPVTQRGFRMFADFESSEDGNVTVQESSLATEYKVWLGSEYRLHLSVEEAKIIRAALDDFINDRHERTVDKEWPPPPTVADHVDTPIKAYTSHGHRIPGISDLGIERPSKVARCGGPGLCKVCQRDAGQALNNIPGAR